MTEWSLGDTHHSAVHAGLHTSTVRSHLTCCPSQDRASRIPIPFSCKRQLTLLPVLASHSPKNLCLFVVAVQLCEPSCYISDPDEICNPVTVVKLLNSSCSPPSKCYCTGVSKEASQPCWFHRVGKSFPWYYSCQYFLISMHTLEGVPFNPLLLIKGLSSPHEAGLCHPGLLFPHWIVVFFPVIISV